MLAAVLDAGAEEVNDSGDSFEVVSEATDLVAVRTALQEAGIDYDSADASFVPATRSRWTRRTPPRCSGSSTLSRTPTTCRTSTPTCDVSDEVMAELEAAG